jgi:hypothetical protein
MYLILTIKLPYLQENAEATEEATEETTEVTMNMTIMATNLIPYFNYYFFIKRNYIIIIK